MRRLSIMILAALVVLAAVSLTSAQSSGWDLTWFTIDGGGAALSSGDRFALSGTIGQPDTGSLSGGVYSLRGGFWAVTVDSDVSISTVYLPLIVRNESAQ